ncbi:hypothetical protein N7457_006393 [Penicillium paradoxum]|uniref:uncharacterized protein n=1 Tax=Penicillium paradoxum TaxID=176176 RepID=UPI0025485C56|nr:uncharacterized protein N7457_006393 [Penicillium paradoxum]KAJ5781233.1 hypothetical protein N7457_006393 [Penicillium paradoxum]
MAFPPSGRPSLFPSRTWIIIEKLSEHVSQRTRKLNDDASRPSFTAAKLISRRSDDPTKLSFMRICLQSGPPEFEPARLPRLVRIPSY